MFLVCWAKDMYVCVCVCVVGFFRGRGLFPREIFRCLLLSLLSGVKRGIEDFCAEADILMFWNHSSKVFIYCWRCMVALLMCVEGED